ncbi:hypothetical protein CHARACLAT_015138 [Characodon lateralis]|uniref:Uncharacterized protein n=1 Tax=Characodon lateralis TaxID=208331 RepID=A0ABU7F370_9TELE|nr:hypothetical protein [Characodon lateralis]
MLLGVCHILSDLSLLHSHPLSIPISSLLFFSSFFLHGLFENQFSQGSSRKSPQTSPCKALPTSYAVHQSILIDKPLISTCGVILAFNIHIMKFSNGNFIPC